MATAAPLRGRLTPSSKRLPPNGVSLGVALAAYILIRVPSWFEPHWYTDEAGYATTAWLSTHGQLLYLTVWNNKPPLLFWIYDLALSWFGTAEFGLHLLSTVAGMAALAALWFLLRKWRRGPSLWVPLLLAAVLLGLPLFNGDLALPENFLIAPEAWAMALTWASLEARRPSRALLLAAGAGSLFALAVLIQQTALGPAAVAALLLLVGLPEGRLRATSAMLGTLLLVVGAGLAPYLIWAGPQNVFYYLVLSYQGYTTHSLPLSAGGLVPRVAALLLLTVGVVMLRRSGSRGSWAMAWVAAELVVYVLPNRAYAHFLLPTVIPACLLLAWWPGWRWWRSRASLLRAPLVAAMVLATFLWVSLYVTSYPQHSLYSGLVAADYVPLLGQRLVGAISADQYTADYSHDALAERLAVAWVKSHGLEGQSTLVWSADSWAYLLGDLRPVVPTPAIYMDAYWLGTSGLIRRVERSRPELVIVTDAALHSYGRIQPILKRDYRQVEVSRYGSVWLRDGGPAST
ncbi:MAG: glycosyltransferase family 39 protein [Acidimicrobiales bacterium]